MTASNTIRMVHAARRGPDRLVLEGFHAIKHALRFGAVLHGLWSDRPAEVQMLAHDLAPDLAATLTARLEAVSPETFAALSPRPPETRLVAVADRPANEGRETGPGPVIVIDRPRHPGNLGAVIRVAAAAEAAAVWSLGGVDPFSPAVLRGAAGLHYAIPVQALERLALVDRPLIALDDTGESMIGARLPRQAIYLFGSERTGLAAELRVRADRRIAIPMRPGVSSLNLATAAAVLLYALRLDGRAAP